jgi:tripartite-type tricarboxylate transporter receptor subunit TctC
MPANRWLPIILGLIAAAPATAQHFPSRPVRMIVPLAPGGPVDFVARIMAARLTEQLGQQVVVDNRPGAGGSVGADLVARAVPDGHTVLLAANGTLAVAPNLLKLPYDVQRDLAAVTLVGTSPQVLVVHPSLPAKSVKDLVALARSRPGTINYASSGQGATSHLASELFRTTARIDIVHVPYKGAGPALTELVGGSTQMMITGVSSTLPYLKSGRLRALGVTSPKRISALPDVPAIAETLPGYEVTTWYGLMTTAGTPGAVVTRLHRETVAAAAHPDVSARLASAGVDAETSSPEQFSAMIRSETVKWGKIIKAAGVQSH